MKAIVIFLLSLLSFSASANLSQQQIHAIQNGWHAPFSQATIDKVASVQKYIPPEKEFYVEPEFFTGEVTASCPPGLKYNTPYTMEEIKEKWKDEETYEVYGNLEEEYQNLKASYRKQNAIPSNELDKLINKYKNYGKKI